MNKQVKTLTSKNGIQVPEVPGTFNSAKGIDLKLMPDKVFLITNKQTKKQKHKQKTSSKISRVGILNSAKGVDIELVPDKVFLSTNKQTNQQTNKNINKNITQNTWSRHFEQCEGS